MDLNSIKNTILWKHLNSGFSDDYESIAKGLASNLISICKEASDRMKKCLALHKEFTLHDEIHLLNVTEIMAKILGDKGIKVLNPVEVFLLILSAYYHDIGMVMDDDKINSLEKNDDFKLFRENWIIEHPNYREIENQRRENQGNYTQSYDDLRCALYTDFIRTNHGTLSKNFVEENYSNDKLWEVDGINISGFVGRLCLSHSKDIHFLEDDSEFRVDENIATYNVNMPYLAIILRLADILDFDRARTPDALYKSIHFTNEISLKEWEKHRSVKGWEISKNVIRFSAECTHPIYQKTVLQFMDLIDSELNDAKSIVMNFPNKVSKYKLNLPMKVDRSRIKPKNNSYIYHDLEFSLSRDEIVKLLMLEELYKNSFLCIRELLQNSLDALRYRKNIIKKDLGSEWTEGKVKFKHYLDDFGREVLLCEDNGIGMDEKIIINHLTKTGRSYYKSPDFEKEKEEFEKKGIVFYPCSQFGIGFMSCFMIGDSITIKTRKYYGDEKQWGKPLTVEINGLNGIIVIKEGDKKQPIGTSVSIVGRTKPKYMDEWEDKVRLLGTLGGYALACEFPIEAECTIDELSGSITIPAGIIEPKTFIEKAGIKSYKTYEQDLSEINANLKGKIKVSFLVDKQNKLTLNNAEAYWDQKDLKSNYELMLKHGSNNVYYEKNNTATCCDGILVCGTPGLEPHKYPLTSWSNLIRSGYESFILDIRNDIKPRLTPSRIAKEKHYDIHPSWRYIQDLMDEAEGKLWTKVLEDIHSDDEMTTFFQIASLYHFDLAKLPVKCIWDKIYIPLKTENDCTWEKLSSVNDINIKIQDEEMNYYIKDSIIEFSNSITQYDSESYGINSINNMYSLIIRISALFVNKDSHLSLHILNPDESKQSFYTYKYDSGISRVLFIPYWNTSDEYFSIQLPYRNINLNHPLTKFIQKYKYKKQHNDLANFTISFMFFATYAENLNHIKKSDNITRGMKWIGCKYKLINWNNYPKECKPDYKCWTKDGVVTFSHELFIKWAQTRNEDLVKNIYA